MFMFFTTNKRRLKWFALKKMFMELVPEMSSYTAMQHLHHVAPAVLIGDLIERCESTSEYGGTGAQILQMGKFLAHRTLCFIIGFDTFLVKARVAYGFINHDRIHLR